MKLEFGTDIVKPTLAVVLSPEEQERMRMNDETSGAYNQLLADKELQEDYPAEEAVRLHFRLRVIARRPEATHENHFGRVIHVLNGIAGYHEPTDGQELRALSLGEVGTDISGSTSLAVEFALPPWKIAA